jgi:membrane-associated protease RseP (regulator of RpoE activity)
MSDTLPPPPAAPPRESGYMKFRNEILAGGASDTVDGQEPQAERTSVAGLLLVIGALAALAVWRPWIFLFVVLLLFCVFLHEVGHFVTARKTGMKATQFFLFMGPKLWSFRRGETEYGIRLYPLGAFVRIIGMNNLDEVDPADEPRAYRNQSYPRRMLVICAGSIMHMLIAIALLFGVYATKGTRAETGEVAIVEVVAGSPADNAGIRADDIVRSVDGVAVSSADEFVTEIQRHQPTDLVPVVISRGGVESTLEVGLGSNPNPGPSFGKAYIGTRSGGVVEWQSMSIVSAATHSITDLGSAAWQSVGGVVKVLNPVNIIQHLTGANTDPSTQPTTVVGVSRYSDAVGADTGVGGVLLMLAGVNVFVGLLNLFPLLPFDGGHAAIATYERLRTRTGQPPYRADVGKMIPVAMTMMGLLAFLMMAGLYLDIVKPIK